MIEIQKPLPRWQVWERLLTNLTVKPLLNNGASGNGGNALAVKVAWFPYMKSTTPKSRQLDAVLDGIQNGEWRDQVEGLRVIRDKKGEDAYNRAKERLPSFYISGEASAPKIMLTHSRLIQVDLDDLGDRLPTIREGVITDPHVAAFFKSPSGGGLKIAFRLEPLDDPLDEKEHKRAFAAVTVYFQKCYGVTPDQSCSNINRHCLVSYDPSLFRSPAAIPFDWRKYAPANGGGRGEDSSLYSLGSPCSLGSLTPQPEPSVKDESAGFDIFDPEPIERAFAQAHPKLARLYSQLLGHRQRPKQRERNQCVVGISTFLVRAVSEKNAMLMLGHWYDLYHRGRFKDTRDQHLKDAKEQWDNALVRYVKKLSRQERRCYFAIESDVMKLAFRILRDCALSPRDEAPPNFYMSWQQLSIRLGVSSDRAGQIFDAFIPKIIKRTDRPVMYHQGVVARSTRYRWLLTETPETGEPAAFPLP